MEHTCQTGSVEQLTQLDNNATDYLTTFAFVRGSYGLRISVVGCMELIESADPSDIVRGVIELRNEKIAVIDPRLWHKNSPTPIAGGTCIVVVEPTISDRKIKVGVVVEDISEVLNIASCSMNKGQPANSSVNIDFILKIGREHNTAELLKLIEESIENHSAELKAN